MAVTAALLLAVLSNQGCIVVPNLAPIKGDKQVARISIGETSRDDVLKIFGKPNVTAGEDFIVYNWEKGRAFVAVGGGYSAAVGPAGHRGYRAVVEFDADDVVADITTSRAKLQGKLLPEKMRRITGCKRFGPWPNAVAISPDCKRTAVLAQGRICLVMSDGTDSAKLMNIGDTGRHVSPSGDFISFSPDGRLLAVAPARQRPSIWDVESGQRVREFGIAAERKQMKWLMPRPTIFSPDGGCLTAYDGKGYVVIWNIDDGTEVARYALPSYPASIRFSPDGEQIAVGLRSGGLEVYETASGRSLLSRAALPKSSEAVAVAFSPDGKWLAVSTVVHVELWNLASLRGGEDVHDRRAILLLPFYKRAPSEYEMYQSIIEFSEDGETLAVFKQDAVILIDLQSLAIRDVYRFKWPARVGAFAPACKRLVAISSWDGLRLWDAPDETTSRAEIPDQ
jgi:WD40 repeat protein